MTKNNFFLLTIFALLLSCNGKTSKSTEKNDVPVDTAVAVNTQQNVNFSVDTAVVREEMTFRGWTYSFDATVAVLPSITDNAFLDSIYHSFIWGPETPYQLHYCSKKEMEKDLKEWGKWLFEEAKENAMSGIDENEETGEKPFDYYYSITMLPVSCNKNLLVMLFSQDTYYGGAHGSRYIQYNVFDLNTKKQIHNTDIFKDIKNAALEKTMLKYYKIESDENAEANWQDCLFDEYKNQIPVIDNFYFDRDKIYFIYNQYEITPYVCGIIEFSLPFNEIQKYLKPEFLELLEKYF